MSSPKNVYLKDIQKHVLETGKELGFGQLNAIERCLMLGEEVGELFKSVRKYSGIKIDQGSKVDSIGDELADVLKQVCAIANYFDIDVEEVFWEKERKNEGRWKTEHESIILQGERSSQ